MSATQRWHPDDPHRKGDSPELSAYAQAMERGEPFIRLRLNVDQPIELSEFLGAFTAVAAEYDRFIRMEHPDTKPTAEMFVKEVRAGSIVADLVPWIIGGGIITALSAANTISEFVERYGGSLKKYTQPGGRVEGATKTQLSDFGEQVAAIASHPNSTLEMAAIRIENGEEKIMAAFRFATPEARDIQQRVEEHKREIDHTSRADHERVLMTFVRSDIRGAAVGKRSGELVEIETISDKPRPLIYASAVAEEQIKHEITDQDSVYKKGFVVDVNVEMRGGKPVAYAVTNLHQVIDLPDDEG